MKHKTFIMVTLCLFLIISLLPTANADIKWIRVGKVAEKVQDNGGQNRGDINWIHNFFYYTDDFVHGMLGRRGWSFTVKDWKDPEGNTWEYYLSGHNMQAIEETETQIPIRSEDGFLIKRYVRYNLPQVFVDETQINEPFPRLGDEVAPEKIPGSADIMVESFFNMSIGLTVHQKAIAYGQKNHDDYIIYDYTFTNTGNVDADPEIELPGQTLKDLVYFKQIHLTPGGQQGGFRDMWTQYYGAKTTDTLRIIYGYDAYDKATFDSYGQIDLATGFPVKPHRAGEAILFASKSPKEKNVNDPAQPFMTASNVYMKPIETNEQQHSPEDMVISAIMHRRGLSELPLTQGWPLVTDPVEAGGLGWSDVYPNTYHHVMPEDLPIIYPMSNASPITSGWRLNVFYSIGPYDLAFGESVRVVIAGVNGTIDNKKAWEIAKQWLEGTCTWDGPEGKNYPPAERVYADQGPNWVAPGYKTSPGVDANDIARDTWISTGTDSLHANANAAQFAVNNDYNIPVPPPPPGRFEVFSRPGYVELKWDNQSESASDFAGYRIYRAKGGTVYSEKGGVVTGDWVKIYECGGNSGNPIVNEYKDKTAVKGADYFYAITAFDDGSNAVGVKGKPEVLESNLYACRTTQPASLLEAAGDNLSEIRVVPNPYNLAAAEAGLSFPGEQFRDKINFVNLPPVCTIRIYNETGDLMKVLHHDNQSGTEAWVTEEGNQYLTTETGQIVVSGIYFAHIEDEDGNSTIVKFIIIR